MSAEPIRKRRSPVSLVIGAPIVLVIVYVFSVGPMVWLVESGHISGNAFGSIAILYAPLNWLYYHISWVEYFFDWYIELWTA